MAVATELPAMGVVAGRWVSMRTESMDRDGIFLISKEYVRPRALLEVLLWIPGLESPLYAVLTATFVERTWDGFGIGAKISSISSDEQIIWNRIYRQAVARSTPGYCASIQANATARPKRLLVMQHALPSSVLDALLEQGLEIQMAATAAQAVKLASGGDVDLMIGALADQGYDGLALCRSLAELIRPPRSLLITQRGTASDFESGIYAGATKVIARPCGYSQLVARIVDLLRSDKYAELDEESEDLAQLESALSQRSEPSRLASASEYLSEQLHLLKLSVRTFLRSSAFERIFSFGFLAQP